MAKKRAKVSRASASIDTLQDAVGVYERAEFGTVAPDDIRLALFKFATWAKEMCESDKTDQSAGEMLLCLLVAAWRRGQSISDVVSDALAVATERQAESDAVLARLADDGCPHTE